MFHRFCACLSIVGLTLGIANPAQATILTFELFDPGLVTLDGGGNPVVENFNNPAVQPFLSAAYGYPEGYRIDSYSNSAAPGVYGSRVASTANTADNGVEFRYGVGGEGFTPGVQVFYGPYSFLTGGPTLWREGYSDLNGVLYQGSDFGVPPIGYDYNFLDIVFVADAGLDVVLYDFDLGSARFAVGNNGIDRSVGSIVAFDNIPFPFITPSNYLYNPQPTVPTPVLAAAHTPYNFGGTPLQSPVIWLRIDTSNLGADSKNIGIDNIRFGQVGSANPGTFNPSQIDAAFVSAEAVPEPGSLTLVSLGVVGLVGAALRRREIQR